MTREEAIDTLKNGLWWDRIRLDEAIDIAISAFALSAGSGWRRCGEASGYTLCLYWEAETKKSVVLSVGTLSVLKQTSVPTAAIP